MRQITDDVKQRISDSYDPTRRKVRRVMNGGDIDYYDNDTGGRYNEIRHAMIMEILDIEMERDLCVK